MREIIEWLIEKIIDILYGTVVAFGVVIFVVILIGSLAFAITAWHCGEIKIAIIATVVFCFCLGILFGR